MRPRLVIPLLLALGMVTGCEPSCEKTCEKLLACEDVDTPLADEQDCEDSCNDQQTLYDSWEDGQKQDDFADLKRCINDSSCVQISEGVCYDDNLYIW